MIPSYFLTLPSRILATRGFFHLNWNTIRFQSCHERSYVRLQKLSKTYPFPNLSDVLSRKIVSLSAPLILSIMIHPLLMIRRWRKTYWKRLICKEYIFWEYLVVESNFMNLETKETRFPFSWFSHTFSAIFMY
jgi:hypothetical protein